VFITGSLKGRSPFKPNLPLIIGIHIHIMERGISPSWKGKGGEVDPSPVKG